MAGHEHTFILFLFLSRLASIEKRSEGKRPYNHFYIRIHVIPGGNQFLQAINIDVCFVAVPNS
jgi:hypothetical protein